MTIELYTWHGVDFDLCTDQVDHSKSIYKWIEYLPDAYKAITECIGTDQFLFGFLRNEDGHLFYEIGKEVCYHLKLPCSQVPLFIRSNPWESAINKGTNPSLAFSEKRTPDTSTAVFLCPVSSDHIVKKEKYRIHSPEKAELIESFTNS